MRGQPQAIQPLDHQQESSIKMRKHSEYWQGKGKEWEENDNNREDKLQGCKNYPHHYLQPLLSSFPNLKYLHCLKILISIPKNQIIIFLTLISIPHSTNFNPLFIQQFNLSSSSSSIASMNLLDWKKNNYINQNLLLETSCNNNNNVDNNHQNHHQQPKLKNFLGGHSFSDHHHDYGANSSGDYLFQNSSQPKVTAGRGEGSASGSSGSTNSIHHQHVLVKEVVKLMKRIKRGLKFVERSIEIRRYLRFGKKKEEGLKIMVGRSEVGRGGGKWRRRAVVGEMGGRGWWRKKRKKRRREGGFRWWGAVVAWRGGRRSEFQYVPLHLHLPLKKNMNKQHPSGLDVGANVRGLTLTLTLALLSASGANVSLQVRGLTLAQTLAFLLCDSSANVSLQVRGLTLAQTLAFPLCDQDANVSLQVRGLTLAQTLVPRGETLKFQR
ncbi:hypothetical protein Ahy_B10g103378 [Arachis hypogaea]|uniref:Uncharacterized protein n=1 Tax=Arachis hypogaea TaxID=3818 RepID=A0A444X3S4_ARAHY|nr:hypothetical protein Ahy_B10g103378 [Arachis hypogaea]